MKFPTKIGIAGALLWITIKLIAWLLEISLNDIKIFVFINMFLLTASIAIGLYFVKLKESESNLLNDIKNGMLAGVPYTIIVSLFMYFYYEKIYPEFNQVKVHDIEVRLKDPKTIKDIQRSNTGMQNKSASEIRNEVISNTKSIYNAKFTMLVALLALMVYSTMNSLLIAVIYRKVVFRN
jgi:hypothetical protein